MKTVAIIDYGMCNLDSVCRAVEKCGGKYLKTRNPTDLYNTDGIILPGVGSFSEAMIELKKRSFIPIIKDLVLVEKLSFLGICLGMHLMADKGYEGGETIGLGLIPGTVERLRPDSENTRIPHIGWNEIQLKKETKLFQGIKDKTDFYFVHSYQYLCDEHYIIGRTPYCGSLNSVIGDENAYGVQFHPEKSLRFGLQIITNFLELC
jgi:glutamine amidotransferase